MKWPSFARFPSSLCSLYGQILVGKWSRGGISVRSEGMHFQFTVRTYIDRYCRVEVVVCTSVSSKMKNLTYEIVTKERHIPNGLGSKFLRLTCAGLGMNSVPKVENWSFYSFFKTGRCRFSGTSDCVRSANRPQGKIRHRKTSKFLVREWTRNGNESCWCQKSPNEKESTSLCENNTHWAGTTDTLFMGEIRQLLQWFTMIHRMNDEDSLENVINCDY